LGRRPSDGNGERGGSPRAFIFNHFNNLFKAVSSILGPLLKGAFFVGAKRKVLFLPLVPKLGRSEVRGWGWGIGSGPQKGGAVQARLGGGLGPGPTWTKFHLGTGKSPRHGQLFGNYLKASVGGSDGLGGGSGSPFRGPRELSKPFPVSACPPGIPLGQNERKRLGLALAFGTQLRSPLHIVPGGAGNLAPKSPCRPIPGARGPVYPRAFCGIKGGGWAGPPTMEGTFLHQ